MDTMQAEHRVDLYDLDTAHPPFTAAPQGPYAARCSCGFMSKPTTDCDEADDARARHHRVRAFSVETVLALGHITAEVAAEILAERAARPCDFCDEPMEPNSDGDWLTCSNDRSMCIDCCDCHRI